MARPKRNETDMLATQKIEQAFWKILETEGYSGVTILRLSQESGYNRNTIYYYYKNVDDIARQAFANSATKQSVADFLNFLLSSPDIIDIEMPVFLNTKRLHLMATSKSAFLHRLVKNSMIEVWLKAFDIDETALTELGWAQLDFIAAGFLTLLSNTQLLKNGEEFRTFPKSPLGQAVIQTLENLPKRVNCNC